jgi:hypothetical protein
MTFKNLFIDHDVADEVKQWLQEEIADQERRYTIIVKEMEDLAPSREQWYQEFFDRITTTGFNTDGDDKMVISKADLPVKPEGRVDTVVWKYGVDGE